MSPKYTLSDLIQELNTHLKVCGNVAVTVDGYEQGTTEYIEIKVGHVQPSVFGDSSWAGELDECTANCTDAKMVVNLGRGSRQE